MRNGLVIAPVALAVAVAGCGGNGQSPAAQPASAAFSAAAPKHATVKTRNGALGTYLVDAKGRTLYLFEKDTGKRSQCSGACAQAWPPLTTRAKPAAKGGAKASLLSTSKRSGGPKQVTYDGHPLYRFAPDTAAGQTKGQGVDGFGALWWVVAPSGEAIESSSAPPGY